MGDIVLRATTDDDLDALFEMMRDPVAVRMAAFTPPDPDDRAAFDQSQARIRSSPEVRHRVVTVDGQVVGSIGSFVMDGDTQIAYWIDRAWWGRGVAGRAVAEFLREVTVERPLFARAASDDVGSLAVLRKAGFHEIGREVSFANARQGEIEETILRLE